MPLKYLPSASVTSVQTAAKWTIKIATATNSEFRACYIFKGIDT